MSAPPVGQRFPSLTLQTAGYKDLRVPEDFASQAVVLSWFPYAFSPTCTEELTGFARVHGELERRGATVLAASCDHWYSNEAYRRALGATYPFASDWFRTEARKLGIFDERKQRSGRAIYVIDRAGGLRWAKVYGTDACPKVEEFLPALDELS